jgi:hypothetical protein
MGTYSRGTNANIIVGAAALFTYENGELTDAALPAYVDGTSYRDTLTDYDGNDAGSGFDFRNVGYTMNGLELQFQPDFGEVQVDQFLDVARLYKQGMQVNLNTTFAEGTLTNLLFALAGKGGVDGDLTTVSGNPTLNLSAGDIGECPVERGLVAVGPGTGDCAAGSSIERVYIAYRALSIESVTASAKRDEATMFEVSFRLLPNNSASYGKIVDRTL